MISSGRVQSGSNLEEKWSKRGATHLAQLGQHAGVDAAFYVDECQNLLNLLRSFDEMLAEARN